MIYSWQKPLKDVKAVYYADLYTLGKFTIHFLI